MKTLVIYYSLDGSTRLIAEAIASTVGADILELKPKKELNSKSPFKYLWGGRQVVMKIKPEILPLEKNPADYEMLFMGTPVWAWNYAPPLATFFAQNKFAGKKVALFCCNGGQKGKTFENMRKELAGNQILGEIEFFEPQKKDPQGSTAKASVWATEISSS
ncbi:MAG: flavodoxin [Patescibacteria group bacterium]|jgi:flavodoxin